MSAIRTFDHLPNKGSTKSRVEYFIFNPEAFKGKGVILFDDIITSGKTFEQTAQRLLNDGAINVVGLFLGRTVKG
jgi:ATP-dependent DNA helicase RecQ